MGLKILSKFLSGLLVLALLLLIVNWVTGQTVLSSSYLKGELKDADAYSRLSGAFSSEVAKQASIQDPQLAATIQDVITPEAVQERVDPALEQFEGYLKGEDEPPQIDVADLVTQLQTAGVPVGDTTELSEPIQLVPQQQEATPLTKNAGSTKALSAAVAVLLLAALAFLSWKTKRYTTLPNVAIVCGVLLGLLALFMLFIPDVLDNVVKFGGNSNTFSSIAADLAKNISHDLGVRYGIISLVLLVLGIALHTVLRSVRSTPTPKPTQK